MVWFRKWDLLRVAENEFDVWVTADKNVEYQQNLDRFDIAIVVLVASRNRLDALLPLIPQLHEVLQVIQPHQIVYVGSSPRFCWECLFLVNAFCRTLFKSVS